MLKSENEILKSSIAFERETGEKLGIQVDQLVIQNNHLKTEVGHLETEVDTLKLCLLQLNTKKQVLEKQVFVLDRWLQKVVDNMDLETCDGDICCVGDDVEIAGTSDPD